MKVIGDTKIKRVAVVDLDGGDVFELCGEYYLRVTGRATAWAYRLSTGAKGQMDGTTLVRRIDGAFVAGAGVR